MRSKSLLFIVSNALLHICNAENLRSEFFHRKPSIVNQKLANDKGISITYRLHDDLLKSYRKGTRPVMHPNKLITVSMCVFLYQIINLDAVKNTISLSGSFELYWKDEFLKWEPKEYGYATEIFLSSSDIWIPEMSLYYSHHFNQAVKLVSNNDVRVNYTGNIRYYIPFTTESLCTLDVKFFPFDIQQCTLMFGSWAHSNDSVKYSLYSEKLSLIDFYDNQEWQLDLLNSSIRSEGFLYDYLDPPLFWEMIIMNLVVKRQSFYYVFNLVVPSTIITLVSVIGFHTPSTSGRVRDAKFRLGIMTLMSMSVILLAIVEDMPKFSVSGRKGKGSFSGIPLIGLYYFILLAIIGLSTVTTSMFVFLERNLRVTRQVPRYLSWLSFDIPDMNANPSTNRREKVPEQSTESLSTRDTQSAINNLVDDRRRRRARYITLPKPSRTKDVKSHLSTNISAYPQIESQNNGNMVDNDTCSSQNYERTTEELLLMLERIEKSIFETRVEIKDLQARDDFRSKWQIVIRRLEIMSLIFYVVLVSFAAFLFAYHDWYCAIGYNPCGQLNLKCPWIENDRFEAGCE